MIENIKSALALWTGSEVENENPSAIIYMQNEKSSAIIIVWVWLFVCYNIYIYKLNGSVIYWRP